MIYVQLTSPNNDGRSYNGTQCGPLSITIFTARLSAIKCYTSTYIINKALLINISRKNE